MLPLASIFLLSTAVVGWMVLRPKRVEPPTFCGPSSTGCDDQFRTHPLDDLGREPADRLASPRSRSLHSTASSRKVQHDVM